MKPIINSGAFAEMEAFLQSSQNNMMADLRDIMQKYGTPEEINRKAKAARDVPTIFAKLREMDYPYMRELEELLELRNKGAFVSMTQYREKVLGKAAATTPQRTVNAVTMEISPLQYFPWFIQQYQQAIDKKEIMPSRYIRLRKMREQEADGDLMAVVAAMQIIGASQVDQIETNGSDGSNVHLGDPLQTIAGYYGGVGQPNDYPLKWVDEALYYYTNFGTNEMININNGTILLTHMLYQMGVDLTTKISVLMGNDNPYAFLWYMMTAKMFQREDGSTSICGLNLSNSVNTETILACANIRRQFGLENDIRIEHHVTEPYKGMVRQPYMRRDQLLEIAPHVKNLSAKHEGGEPEIEAKRRRPSCHQDNFLPMDVVKEKGIWDDMQLSFMDKHHSLNLTAQAMTENGLAFIGAKNLHRR